MDDHVLLNLLNNLDKKGQRCSIWFSCNENRGMFKTIVF